jgi:light-regulated signal transduction histidine kinase (bacteriophytochrome)
LRAPLRVIQGFANILLDEHAQILDDEGAHLLRVIVENVGKMDALITALLNLARVARSELACCPVDMTALVAETYQALADAEIRQSFTFTLHNLPPANGDPMLLRQVWFNLLSNAIKFTRVGSQQVIEVGFEPGERENIYFVRDSGVGFDPQYAHKLFGVFQRLHRVEEFEGVGIGLAIVQRVIQRHGGRVWAEGRPGAGATFYFSLCQE